MNLFEAVKEVIPTKMAAEKYSIEVRRNGMVCCPFHDDHEPSMKLDRRFHCFSCQSDGDVIDFTSRLFGLNFREAAEKLDVDFGVRYEQHSFRSPLRQEYRPSIIVQLDVARQYQKAKNRFFRVLCDYFHLFQDWKERYAPQLIDEEWHPLFCEALKEMDYTDYLLIHFSPAVLRKEPPLSKKKEKKWSNLNNEFQNLPPEEQKAVMEVVKEMNQPLIRKPSLSTLSMSELYDMAFPPRTLVIDGLLYRGTYLFAGSPKIGKSFL